jgi:hypothetical protein
MCGNDEQLQSGMFGYVSLDERIREGHFLRAVRKAPGGLRGARRHVLRFPVALKSLNPEF